MTERSRQRSRGDSDGFLTRRTVIGSLLVGGAGVAGIQGTGAFSSVIGDRGLSVGTTGDETALLGIESKNPSGQDGDVVDLLSLTNHTSTAFTDVTVFMQSTGNPAVGFTGIDTPLTIEPGTTETVQGTLSCERPVSDVAVKLEIAVSGTGVAITAMRSVRVSCEVQTGPTITAVDWKGGGINPIASPDDTEITVDVWYYAGRGLPGPGSDEFDVECGVTTTTNSNINKDLPGQASTHVAVYVHESNESWHHPSYDPATGELTGWDNNASGVHWGAGSIASAFEVTCNGEDDEEGPPAEEM